ncbi:MAG: thiamine pyrophosphate-binding protein [Proteobacteria bacterium]|nr:thiamine pyrophosphate-binding protein [Pseudomonadota bacterium]
MIQRSDLLRAVREATSSEIVVSVMSAVKGWDRLPEHFFWCTAMGYGSSVGLGLALAQPDRKVIVLDGDGSLLMNLGSLVTIAGVAPPNLIHVVLENGLYELPGAVELPGEGRFSLSAFARAAGWTRVWQARELGEFESRLAAALNEPGPVFLSAEVAPGSGEGLPKMTLVGMTRELTRALEPE